MGEEPTDLFRSLTVLSLEQAMALPFLTMRLAQEGMRVIRVEAPPRGDPNRWVGASVLPLPDGGGGEQGMGSYFLPNNLGKQAITLNLATAGGQAVLRRMIRELPVDVFATNLRPRSYRKLGIDEASLRSLRPELIWLGITGFGPDHDEAAYDPILQARAGFMDLTGEPGGDPMVFGLPMADLGAAEHAYGQVMRALAVRTATGRGERIDLSMYQSAVSWLATPVMLAKSFGETVTRRGNTHPFFAPVSVYPTQDGHVYLAVGNDRQWEALTQMRGFQELARSEYAVNAGRIERVLELNLELAALTRQWSAPALIAECGAAGVPVSRVYSVREVCQDTLLDGQFIRARDERSGVEICLPPPPVVPDYLRKQGMTMDFPPRLGEHNAQVYGGLGLDLAALEQEGTI